MIVIDFLHIRSRGRSSRSFPFSLRFPRRFRRFWRLKRKERNIPAACASLAVIAFLVCSLVMPSWFYLFGGACKRHSLGALDFFSLGVGDLQRHPRHQQMDDAPQPRHREVNRSWFSECLVQLNLASNRIPSVINLDGYNRMSITDVIDKCYRQIL